MNYITGHWGEDWFSKDATTADIVDIVAKRDRTWAEIIGTLAGAITRADAERKKLMDDIARLERDLQEIYDHSDATQNIRSIVDAALGR